MSGCDGLLQEGQELFAKDDFEGSYRAYKRAWDLKPTFDVAGNLGNVEAKLGKWAGAIVHLRFALANLPLTMPDDKKKVVEAKLQDRIAEATSKVHIITFALSPAGAVVTVDGDEFGTTPLTEPVVLDPGPHKIVATHGRLRRCHARADGHRRDRRDAAHPDGQDRKR